MLPNKFEAKFEELGIDIHDPKYAVWWEKSQHRKAAKEYNKRFQEFFNSPNANDPDKALEFGRSMMRRYGIDVDF